jgi:hypothetical protein
VAGEETSSIAQPLASDPLIAILAEQVRQASEGQAAPDAVEQNLQDIEGLQRLIAEGADPTAIGEAPAAGPDAGSSGSDNVQSGGLYFPKIERTAEEVLPDAGFDTAAVAKGTVAVKDNGYYRTTATTVTPTIDFNTTSSSGAESVSSADLTVDLSAALSSDVTVDYTVTGTATGSGIDYTLASGTLTISAGNTSGTISIASIVSDSLDEVDETVIVTLSNASNATLGTDTVHTYTITDDDSAPSLSIDDVGKSDESAVDATFTVTLSAASAKEVTVDYEIGRAHV